MEFAKGKKINGQETYLSRKFSFELSFIEAASTIERGCTLTGSSTFGELNINDDSNGSGSVLLEEERRYEDPPRRDCKFPSRSSFLNMENVELDPTLRNLLLRCT